MSNYTNYSTLSDKELLSFLDSKRAESPVIQELCSRLEARLDDIDALLCTSGKEDARAVCPICEAKVTITTTIDLNKESHAYGLRHELVKYTK